jgi:two-component sensor histidine kinase
MRHAYLLLILSLIYGGVSIAQLSSLDSLQRALDSSSSTEQKVDFALQIADISSDEAVILSNLELARKLASGQSDQVRVEVLDAYAEYYYRSKRYELAISEKAAAVNIRRSLNDKGELADALYRIAKFERAAYQLDNALVSYREAADYYASLENYDRQINCLNKIGVIHKNLGDYAQALPLYHRAYNLALQYGLEDKQASTAINIGVVLKKEEKYTAALEQYYLAEEIDLKLNNYTGLANVYNNIGNVLRLEEKYQDALKYYRLALVNRKKSGKNKTLSYTYNNMSIVYKELGDLSEAVNYLKKAEKEKLDRKDYESIASTYLNFSEIYLDIDDDKNFLKYATLSEKYATQYDQSAILRSIKINFSKFEAANGNFEEAYFYLQHVYDDLDTLDSETQKVLTSVLQAQFDDEQSQTLISTLSKTNAELDIRTKELEEKESGSLLLIVILGIVSIILILIGSLLFYKQRAYARQSEEMNSINDVLRTTMISKEEKETLLKEIHHRVKNNLQIIKSLIRLQNNDGLDRRTQVMLLDFEQRVASMALVHESMYKSGDLAVIDINKYYHDLINDLINAYNLDLDVKKELSIDIENLGIDTLVPLGLLTNEIITNSLKHAFSGMSEGTIKVDLRQEGRCKVLLIGDDGVGFNLENAQSKEQTLGLELISALVEQLDGEYEFNNDGGSHFRIKFDCE